ncbi:uncharacterized protein J8A68_003460 [[Candida] subhashii]|uniref:EH domain-containing and endocytosis protein 1 n=1 Tax=[Candida] subhashii TaxID=561895 RepID=A0A8J5UHK0_9ASCO|nr:uncharacterized protein J8A68_003460 [[Candida] subhashii]KAG7663033.1 hypothetical protein J8A68_003460 [[Candida] subhashii]
MSVTSVGLTPEEKMLYTQLFRSLDPDNTGVITGEKSRSTFEKSGLPPAILGEIWQIADPNNLGFLSQFGFCYAMRLIGYIQAGQRPVPGLGDVPGPLPKFANLNLQLQPQSTNSSFMSTQPTSIIPQDPITPVSPTDFQKFSQLFEKTVGSVEGNLAGPQARDIFLKAKLPTPVLGQIWALVDRYNTGQLNVGSFAIAMHLIQGLLSGQIKQLPVALPESVWQSVEPSSLAHTPQMRQASLGSINSQQTAIRHPSIRNAPATDNEWNVSPAMKQQYDSIFNNLDKDNVGHLNPDQVANFLMTSNLNQQDLATIWDLSDIQNTGIFTKLEFSIALFLVNKKLAGDKLPNIVPDALLSSLKSQVPAQQQIPSQSVPVPPATQNFSQPRVQATSEPVIVTQAQVPKSSLDDLADIFGSVPKPNPAAAAASSASPQPVLQQRASSSDLSRPIEPPKVRSTLTGSFRPTSQFGQSLLEKNKASTPTEENHQESLLLEDATSPAPGPESASMSPQVTASRDQKVVNYDALRNVPPPPKKAATPIPKSLTPGFVPPSVSNEVVAAPPPPQTANTNEDLLADPAISGQLSQATTDIANVSNQIKSLATQTTNLHEKKTRAEQELARILSVKVEIDNKLKQFRVSYENEVKQVEQVEASLAAAKEGTEALRSEASIAEAKLNSLTTEFNEKQLQLEELQKENGSLKEKLGTLNAEIAELENQTASKQSEYQGLSNQVSVKKSQVQVAIVKVEELKNKVIEIENSNKQLQLDLDNAERERLAAEREQRDLEEKARELELKKPTAPSPGIALPASAAAAAGVGIGALAGAAIGGIVATETGDDHTITEQQEQNESGNEVQSREIPDVEAGSVADVEDVNKRFPDLGVNEPADNFTNATSSVATDNVDENETPITSPSNSEFQYPQGANVGIAGGMVGMPGVLVGVQRTDSLTSSVQNNAALSVRDDNLDEISDRDTLSNAAEETLPNTAGTENFDSERSGDMGSGKESSGIESFEMVNSEDVNSPNGANEEFPPIRELEIQESDSSDEETEAMVDALPEPNIDEEEKSVEEPHVATEESPIMKPSFDDFDSAFDNLQPATPEVNQQDLFADEFNDLEDAQEDNQADEFGDEEFGGLSNEFSNSNAPDFSAANTASTPEGNDEWEQLFAGFGNAQPETGIPVPAEQESQQNNSNNGSNKYAIQELVGMGFDEETAIGALTKENWNLEAATNYLLDNA